MVLGSIPAPEHGCEYVHKWLVAAEAWPLPWT